MATKATKTYAAGTDVSEGRSREEIERELAAFGADEFGYLTAKDHAAVSFVHDGRRYVLRVSMPTEPRAGKDHRGYNTTIPVDQQRKSRWRVLTLGIKAILVMVTEGVMTLDEVLLPYLLLPSGETVGDRLMPELRAIDAERGPDAGHLAFAVVAALPEFVRGATAPRSIAAKTE